MDTYDITTNSNLEFVTSDSHLSLDSIISSLVYTFCCKRDNFLTLEPSMCRFADLIGYTPYEIETKFHNQLIPIVSIETRSTVVDLVNDQLNLSNEIELVIRLERKDRSIVWTLMKGVELLSKSGEKYIYGTFTNLNNSRLFLDNAYKVLEQYQIILSQTENIIFELDVINDTVYFSDTWKDIFGYNPAEKNIIDNLISTHLHPDDGSILLNVLATLKQGEGYQNVEVRIAKEDGAYLWCRVRATGIYDDNGAMTKIVGIIINIDSEKRASAILQERAEQDALTKLLNNSSARKQCEKYLCTLSDNEMCALLIVDLDNFKYINDHFGHMYGDKFLVHTAEQIKKLFRSKDILARIGGDEFLIMMRDIPDADLVKKRATQLITEINDILDEHPNNYVSSCSIGISFGPEQGTNYNLLFEHADAALYEAKRKGRNCYSIYTPEVSDLHE